MGDGTTSELAQLFATIPGRDFLGYYAVWFLVCWVGLLFLRKLGHDTSFTSFVMLALYEGVGLARYFIGSAHGMQRWTFLVIMMIVGGLFFIVRVRNGGSSSESSGGWFSSCGTSSGGGCGGGSSCGGGGCGGCGS